MFLVAFYPWSVSSLDGSWEIGWNTMQNAYILWILGGLFGFLSLLLGVIGKVGLLMFQWRREIDQAINANSNKIAAMGTDKDKIARNEKEIDALRVRVGQMRESRLIDRRQKDDDMDDDP